MVMETVPNVNSTTIITKLSKVVELQLACNSSSQERLAEMDLLYSSERLGLTHALYSWNPPPHHLESPECSRITYQIKVEIHQEERAL